MNNHSLPRSTPEAQGVSSSALLKFVNALEQQIDEPHSLMLLRRGAVIAEGWWAPCRPESKRMLFSLSKSFASTAIGLLVAEGKLSIDDLVISLFPELTPANPDPNLAQMRVRHLLSMSTGHDKDVTDKIASRADFQFVRAFLELPVEHQPGAHFAYNSAATYMLSAIVQKLSGQPLVEYLRPRLFEPLGIQGEAWDSSPEGINFGGWGLYLSTEDIARFGQLFLQQGVWQGRQLVPADWVAQASSKQVSNGDAPRSDWAQGYGFQFWCCRHNIYRGDGAFGQYCIIMPDQEAVLVMTGGVGDMQKPLNVVWEKLLPAFGPAKRRTSPLSQRRLTDRLASLHLPIPSGSPASPLIERVSGRTYQLEANPYHLESIRLDFSTTPGSVTLRAAGVEQRLAFGSAGWLDGVFHGGALGLRPVAACGVWSAPNTFTLQIRYFETPFFDTHHQTFSPDGSEVTLSGGLNLSFGPTKYDPIKGKAE